MTYQARSRFEHEVLERFEEKLEDSDELSDGTVDLVGQSIRENTLSQQSLADELAEELIEVKILEAN